MTKSELSHCKNLSRRRLQRDAKCKAALQTEKKPVAKSLTKTELRHCKGLSQRQLKRNSKCTAALRAEKKPAVEKAPTVLSKAEQGRCKKMSYSQLLRNKDCAALLQREVRAGEQTKHRSKTSKASESPRKAQTSRNAGKKSARHHRS